MKRKLVKQSKRSLTTTLPIKWIKKNHLKQGDEIDIKEENNHLIISDEESNLELRKIEIPIEIYERQRVRWLISHAYDAGYDEIILKFKTNPPLNEINNSINTFTGLTLTNQKRKEITLRCFLPNNQNEVNKLIIKMFQVICSLTDDIHQVHNKINLKRLTYLFEKNMRLRDQCLRIIHQTQYGADRTYDWYSFVLQLERITSTLFYLGRKINTYKLDGSEFLEKSSIFIKKLYSCYLKKDFIIANKLWQEIREETHDSFHEKKVNNFIKKHNSPYTIHYYNLLIKLTTITRLLVSISSHKR